MVSVGCDASGGRLPVGHPWGYLKAYYGGARYHTCCPCGLGAPGMEPKEWVARVGSPYRVEKGSVEWSD